MNARLLNQEGHIAFRYGLFLGLLVVLGFWLRIRNLGDLSLIVDEGVQALAVEAILQHGVPEVDSGATYLRGPLFLYIQAALASIFGLNEFWLRLPGVLFGVAAIIPTYYLGKLLFNRPVGVISALVIAFSIWEIEISRYARVYIALQFFFLLALICFYRGFMLDERKFKIYFLAISFIAFLTHELSQLIITLFAIPLLSSSFSWKRKLQFGYWAAGLLGLLVIAMKLNGFYLPAGNSWGPPSSPEEAAGGMISQIRQLIGIPPLNGPDMSHFMRVFQQDPGITAAFAFVAGLATVYLLYQLTQKRKGGEILLGLLVVWAGFSYQFGLVLIFAVLYLAIYARDLRIWQDRVLVAALGSAFLCFAGWFVVLARSSELLLIEVPLVLFDFPALYKYLLRWLAKGWPLMSVFLVLGSVWLLVRFIKDRQDAPSLFLLGALYVPALSASLFESTFGAAYTLHLYPLIVLIFVFVIWKITILAWEYMRLSRAVTKRVAFFVLAPVVLLATQDINPVYAWSIGERTYQSEKRPIRNVINFRFYSDFHQDVRSVALFVKNNLSEGDKVVAIGPDHVVQIFHYYIGDVDYRLTDDEEENQYGINDGKNTVHYITGSKLITDIDEFKNILERSENQFWLVGDYRILLKDNPYLTNETMKKWVRKRAQQPDYIGHDEITFALKIEDQSQ